MGLKRSQFKRKPAKEKWCIVCGNQFTPAQPMQNVCTTLCALTFGREKVKAEKTKEFNKARTELKQKSVAWWIEKVKKVCNQYIRFRDRDLPCISCGTTQTPQWDAGHFRPAGNNSALRFDEDNIHKQCCTCNDGRKKSGNLTEYRKGLLLKIGPQRLERLETHPPLYRWTVEELKGLDQLFKQKLKSLQDRI